MLCQHAGTVPSNSFLSLQVKVEQTDKQLQEMQDAKSKGQKAKQKQQVYAESGH